MQRVFSQDEIADYVESQLQVWPLAKRNYDALSGVQRRKVDVNGYDFYLQFNPARIVSTGAAVDEKSLKERQCFLCRDNRPDEQFFKTIHPGWEMLVNPYPILPIHLTIVSCAHKPQSKVPDDIVEIALKLPGMAIFFNGSKAGASAPDHLHLQAVLKDELPLLRLVETIHPESAAGVFPSDALLPRFPYLFFSGVVSPDNSGLKTLLAGLSLGGSNDGKTFTDHSLVNTFFWIGKEGKLRFVSVPRKSHRPQCYYEEGDKKILVSPGCIDMTGLLILPRLSDFKIMDAQLMGQIYSEVAFMGRNHEK